MGREGTYGSIWSLEVGGHTTGGNGEEGGIQPGGEAARVRLTPQDERKANYEDAGVENEDGGTLKKARHIIENLLKASTVIIILVVIKKLYAL